MVAMAAIAALVGLLSLVELLLVTPREAVDLTLREIARAVEANDQAATLSYIYPLATETRADVEALMPRVEIFTARVTDTPRIEVNQNTSPMEAVANFRAFIEATVKKGGMKGVYFDEIQVRLVHSEDRWLIRDYTPAEPWRVKRNAARGRR